MKIGVVCGSFDLIHNGHLNLISRAIKRCDMLIVGVNSDGHIIKNKKHPPVLSQSIRLEIMKSLKYVTQAYIIDSGIELVKNLYALGIKVDEYYRGDDMYNTPQQIAENQQLEQLGIKPIYFKYTKNISSTKIRNSLPK